MVGQVSIPGIEKAAPVRAMLDEKIQLRMQYLGALGLLASIAVHIGNGPEADDYRDSIAQALADAQEIIPGLRWKQTLPRFDIWMEQ